MININIEQIQYFLAIKKNNSFSTAAHELCISQSSLSKHIKALETELDTILFDRTSRTIKLTDAGEDFYIYAINFLDEYNNIIQGMKKHSLSNKKTLNIGSIAVITQYGITTALALFKSKYPKYDINIIEDENEAIIKMLLNSQIDFAIVRDSNLSSKLFDITPLAEDELVVVTSKTHPFTKKKSISFADLKDENIIMCSKSGVYDVCVSQCNKLNFKPNVIFNISKIETILGLVSEDLGITLIANNVLKPFKDLNICIHSLESAIPYNLALAVKKDNKSKEFTLFKNLLISNTTNKV